MSDRDDILEDLDQAGAEGDMLCRAAAKQIRADADALNAQAAEMEGRVFDLSSRGYGLRVRLLDYLNSQTMTKHELRRSFDDWENATGPKFVLVDGAPSTTRTDLCNAEEAVAIERRRCATILIDTLRDAKKEHASNKTLARFLEEALKEVQNG